ncbi:hypothetical protein BRADI_4g02825v3, partial [Brachypodium distachyon]
TEAPRARVAVQNSRSSAAPPPPLGSGSSPPRAAAAAQHIEEIRARRWQIRKQAMEAALVSVATGAMKPLLGKLSKLLEEECSKLKGVRRQARFLRDEMESMSGTLQMLADSEDLDPEIRTWRDGLRDLSYDMEDCVDRFAARVDHPGRDGSTGLKKLFRRLRKLKPRHEMANEIEELKDRAVEISKRHKRYNFVKPTSGSTNCAIDPRLPAFYVEVDKLVGIDAPKKWLTEELKSSSTQLKVVSIVGSGGLGKTTLANQVYQDIKNQYKCTAFVSVSRNPNVRTILRRIAEQVGATDNTSNDDVKQLIDKLRDHLQDKPYFVVIDDVWDAEAWETISLALFNNNQGRRIITTTRNITVASCCSCQGGYVYRMEPLSFADSKRLFYKRAFNSEGLCYPHLEEVSNEILKKCAGLPLAIITMSCLLADQSAKDEWERLLAAIGSAIAKDPNAGNMTKILSLSYFDLPHHLRTCLLYLTVFPEDYMINKQRLISRWNAEGFIHEEQGRSMYEVGEGYFNDLVNRSLIHPVGVKYGQAEACQVHDVILDFITCKAAEENFITSSDARDDRQISGYKVRRFCIQTGGSNKKVTISC